MLNRTGILVALAFASGSLPAQRGRGDVAPAGIQTVLKLDSARIINASVSPDGRWILFTQAEGDGGNASVWMAAMSNPKPFRLTSSGYSDHFPTVSPTGDKVFFVSDRPRRDGRSTATYVMSIPIDKATGRPVGAVRQVTTDTVAFLPPYGFSPDGGWLAYVIPGPPPAVRIVPTNGGNARTLATKGQYAGSWATFTADGKNVVFQDSGTKLLKEVAAAGGPVRILVTATEFDPPQAAVVPLPGSDMRFLVAAAPASGVFEVREKHGPSLGVARIPPGYGSFQILRSDGRGWVGVRNESGNAVKRLRLETGAVEDILAPIPGWPFGVAADGSINSMSGTAARSPDHRVVLSTYSSTGKPGRPVTLAAEIDRIVGLLPGARLLLGIGDVTHRPTNTMVGNAQEPVPAYVVDRTTGAARLIAQSTLPGCCPRNWGADEDAVGIAELRGSTVDVKSVDASGATHLVRSFPLESFRRFRDLAIRGARVAYADSTGEAESSIFVVTSPTSTPVRIATVAADQSDKALAWSPDGRKLALAYTDAKPSYRAMARVFDVADDGSLIGSAVQLDLGSHGDYYENIAWLPDQSALLVMKDAHLNHLVLRPLDPSRPAVLLDRHEPRGIGSFMLEPGGKSVLYTVSVPMGASIWTAEFQPEKKPD